MISILIPVFNFDVNELVKTLHEQYLQFKIDFEIRCYEDGSVKGFADANDPVKNFSNVIHKKFEVNSGRSKIRNLLATEAAFDQLLFMDCDSKVVSENYISHYLEAMKTDAVICGGRTYKPNAPADEKKILRWKFGTHREMFSAKTRMKNPYDSFMTNNFLIPKNIFLSIRLDETLKGYGHEDTKFGYALNQHHHPVIHIDNPLEHTGLEDAGEFLNKTDEGVFNLFQLYSKNELPPAGMKNILLVKYFRLIRKFGLRKLFVKTFFVFEKRIKKNLLSAQPKLFLFDVYKLANFTKLTLKK